MQVDDMCEFRQADLHKPINIRQSLHAQQRHSPTRKIIVAKSKPESKNSSRCNSQQGKKPSIGTQQGLKNNYDHINRVFSKVRDAKASK